MTTIVEKNRNEDFILTEANGCRSRETVSLASGQDYESGSIVAQYDGAAVYELVNAINLAGATDVDAVAIVCRHTNATDSAKDAAVIARDAEVVDTELVFGDGITLTDVAGYLKSAGIVVRVGG